MRLSPEDTPKFLLDVENRLRENCRDWLVVISHENETYYLTSNMHSGIGFGRMVSQLLEDDFVYGGSEEE